MLHHTLARMWEKPYHMTVVVLIVSILHIHTPREPQSHFLSNGLDHFDFVIIPMT